MLSGGPQTLLLLGASWGLGPWVLGTEVLSEATWPPEARHSPAEERLLQAPAGGEGLASEHVAHDNMQTAGHEGQHGVRLQGTAAGHQAEALQRGALAEGLEELGVGTEVGLLQPAGEMAL